MSPSETPRDLDWRHLHPVAALSAVGRQLGALVPLFIVALIGGRRGDGSTIGYFIFAGGLVLSFVAGIGGWLRFRYAIDGDELRVEQGLLVRHRTFVPRSRIVAMDETASVLERLFGLVRLRIKTAAAGTQVELAAIRRSESQRIQRLLGAEPASSADVVPKPVDARYLLGARELLMAASTSGRLGVLLSGVAWLFSQLDELLLPWATDRLKAAGVPSPALIAALAVLTLLATWIVSVGFEIIKYGRFCLERRGRELVVRHGLLERREVVIALARVQAIVFVEGLLRQPFGFGSVVVESAGHADAKGKSTVLHPFLHRSAWPEFLERVAPEHAAAAAFERPPRRSLPRFLLRPIIASLVVALALSALSAPAIVLSIALLPAAIWLGFLRFRDTGACTAGRVLIVQSRNLRRRTAFVTKNAIGYGQLQTSILQQRRRLSTFQIAVASGAGGVVFGARDLDTSVAGRLLAWCSPARSPGHELH